MQIETIVEGPFSTNTYLLFEDGSAVVLDPGFAVRRVLKELAARHLTVEAVVVTHGHVDHVASAMDLVAATGAPLFFPEADLDLASGHWQDLTYERPEGFTPLAEGMGLTLLGERAEVLHTPGHTPGEVSILIGSILFSGDTLFAGTIGRPDLGLEVLVQAIREKLLVLPDDTRVLPGHGPETTIGVERRMNPFLVA